jgi:hypothetical protein
VEDDSLHILQHILSPDTENPDPLPRQPQITHRVPFRRVTTPMHLAIDFNGKPVSGAEEVQYIDARRVLAPKAQSCGSFAQFLPEQYFGQGHGLAQNAGATLRVFWAMEHGRTLPHRLACGQPPPLSGEDFRSAMTKG